MGREVLTGHATVLLVEDLQRATEYYRDRLGFKIARYDEEPDRYGSAERDGCHVHFAHYDGAAATPHHHAVPPDLFDQVKQLRDEYRKAHPGSAAGTQ